VLIGDPAQGEFVLVDAGMPGSGAEIIAVVEERFGKGRQPAAIVLTHGHFDHVGSITHLLEKWDVMVYAHRHEFPYLTGVRDYPAADGSVAGKLLAKLSPTFPHQAIDITERLLPLEKDMPFLPGWNWIETPGHSPGHVSFFRESDRTLVAGDAFVTVRQDSFYQVLLQTREVNGPPRYLTTDWKAAKASVEKLYALHPEVVITGHGQAMEGTALHKGLQKLVMEFDETALPAHGKFVNPGKDSL
jgi:glyoxylase-like metal-dependent hydrolase (beta-lactamase superfamily II)